MSPCRSGSAASDRASRDRLDAEVGRGGVDVDEVGCARAGAVARDERGATRRRTIDDHRHVHGGARRRDTYASAVGDAERLEVACGSRTGTRCRRRSGRAAGTRRRRGRRRRGSTRPRGAGCTRRRVPRPGAERSRSTDGARSEAPASRPAPPAPRCRRRPRRAGRGSAPTRRLRPEVPRPPSARRGGRRAGGARRRGRAGATTRRRRRTRVRDARDLVLHLVRRLQVEVVAQTHRELGRDPPALHRRSLRGDDARESLHTAFEVAARSRGARPTPWEAAPRRHAAHRHRGTRRRTRCAPHARARRGRARGRGSRRSGRRRAGRARARLQPRSPARMPVASSPAVSGVEPHTCSTCARPA